MNLIVRAALAAVLTSVLALSSTPPVAAVTTVGAEAGNVRIVGDTCDRTRVAVSGDWDVDAYNEIEVDVRGPGGRRVDGAYRSDEYTGGFSFQVRLCKRNTEGRYRVEVRAEGFDEDYLSTGVATGSTTFRFVKEPKRNSTVLRDVYFKAGTRYPYKVPGRLKRGERGYERKVVELYAKVDGYWFEIDQMRSRNRGKFGWSFKPNPYTWAYVFQGDRTTQWDSSKNFRTPRRASARASVTDSMDPRSFIRPAG